MREPVIILLVEDSEDDILLVRKAFAKADLPNPLFVVRNGEQAIHYLMGEGKYVTREEYPLPDLVLLDLKMPGTDGFEVLQWIRSQPSLRALRVIVLTSSDHYRDIDRAYALGANSYLLKPTEFEHFTETSKLLQKYWLFTDRAPQVTRESDEKTKPTITH